MTGLFFANNQSHVRTEIFSKYAVSVIPSEHLSSSDSLQTINFARQIADLKSFQTYDNPFYVMDIGQVAKLIDEWKAHLPRVIPFYSIKCNDDAVLLKLLAGYGNVGFYCQSRQNMEKALELVGSDRILYSNPMWTRSTLSQAMEDNVNLLTFESTRDLDRILMNHPNAELLLHICVNEQSEDTNATMGCDLRNAPELLQLAASSGANCIGISFTIGSKCCQPELYASAIESTARLFDYGRQLGLNMTTLNLGGGFTFTQTNFPQICKYINGTLEYFFPSNSYEPIRIIATPGRFFAGSPFSLITSIVGRRFVDLSCITNDDFDVGREAIVYQTNESYYGPFSCRLNAIEPECRPLFDHYLDDLQSEHVYGSIVGSTLDDMDVVKHLCRFRPLNEGDWLIWQNMGAYTMNNKGSLDDDQQIPSIFYFASQKEWENIEFAHAKNDESVPTTPVHSICDEDETNSCGRESIFSPDPENNDDFMLELDEQGDENFLTMFAFQE